MKQRAIPPDDYSYAIDDGKTIHLLDMKDIKKSLPKGRRNSAGTNKAKALLKRLGL